MTRRPKPRLRSLADVGEFGLIARLTRELATRPEVALGVGDDAALLDIPRGYQLATTTDLLVEDVHFRRRTIAARALGYKSLAVNLSDLAAMGAEPLAALVSLALPSDLPLRWIDAFYAGMNDLAVASRTAIVGGDTTGTPGPIVVNLACFGLVKKGQALTRSGARPGDTLWICGPLGLSRAGLELLEEGRRGFAALRRAHLWPRPCLAEGRALAASKRCTACIDVSDGLLGDLRHIVEMSGVGARIEFAALPIDPSLARYADSRRRDPVEYVLRGGEDYALLFTLKGSRPPAPWPISAFPPVRIGTIIKDGDIRLLMPDGREVVPSFKGYDHFC
ncbi:MAG: thiamine-phosphate kinase [Myxococcales bacterium]|nr:MAG: thiamine-phosphate kinase [Myxococcales bacterium]